MYDVTELKRVLTEYMAWALETFPEETIEEQAIHLRKELAELRLSGEAEELADCLMLAHLVNLRLLWQARDAPFDVVAEVRRKLEINRRRKWVRTPEGDYQHVEEQR